MGRIRWIATYYHTALHRIWDEHVDVRAIRETARQLLIASETD